MNKYGRRNQIVNGKKKQAGLLVRDGRECPSLGYLLELRKTFILQWSHNDHASTDDDDNHDNNFF